MSSIFGENIPQFLEDVMESTIIYTRIKGLCDERGITISRLETELDFSKATIRKWNGASVPMIDKLVTVADYFDVSVDYLAGRTDFRTMIDDYLANEEYREAQRKLEKLTPDVQKRSISFFAQMNDILYDSVNRKEDEN